MWMTTNWLERNTTLIRCGEYLIKKSNWENQHPSLIMYTSAALKDNVTLAKILWTMTEPCLNHEFSQVELQNFHTPRIFVFLHGLMIWKVMRRNAWSDIVSWQTRRLNNSTKYLLHASMTTTLKRKNEICRRIVTSTLSNCSEMFVPGTFLKT